MFKFPPSISSVDSSALTWIDMAHCNIRIIILVALFLPPFLFSFSLSPFSPPFSFPPFFSPSILPSHPHPSHVYLPTRLQPLHDSDSILLVRSSHYRKHVGAVREWYNQEHDNWHVVNGEQSQWWVWNKVRGHALHYALQIQQYLTRITAGLLYIYIMR